MNCFGFVIVFGLSCVLFPCKGQITSPRDGSNMTVLPGSTVNIAWSFSDDVSQLVSRAWYFTSSDGSFANTLLAIIIRDGQPQIEESGLSKVSIVKPASLLLKNVNQTYDGTYRFDLSGPGGGGSSKVVVYIAITPAITVNCSTPTTLIEGDNFACECKGTDGNPSADVAWYKNNTQIVTRKEEAILSLRNVGKNNNGSYKCEAKSGIEEAKNETSIDLIVNLIPIITVNCSSVNTVNRSDNFVCKCEGKEGYLPANVTWYKNNTQIVTGKEEAILVLSNVDKSGSGTYRCEAKSSENAKNETSIEFMVNYPPENVRLMLTRRAQRASITCTAEARPAPSFKIFRNETVLVKTNKTYIIPEVNGSHVGNYTCVAENLLGKKSSKPKYISFEATPIITVNCSNPSTVHKGDIFACECKGTDGYPPANVTWYKDNTTIGNTGKEEAILVFGNVDKDDNGTYRCEAKSHENAKNETSVDLIITITPMITVNCSNVTYANQSDNFACECNGTDGNPPADVTWYNSSGKIVTGKENAILSLSNVSREDNGTYRCEAKSHEMARNEISIDLFVTLTPNITVNCSSPTTLPEGDNLKCKCRGTDGNPPADVTWYNSSRQIVAVGNKKEEAILVLSNVGGDDSGTYRCEAKSHENAREFVLKVNVKTSTTTATSSTTMKPGPTHKDEQSDELSSGVIAGIIVGVLALLGIIIFVVYYIKTRKRQGYKGNANVNPDDADVVELKENEGFAKGENSYDSVKADDAYASVKGDNAYDSIKGDNAYDSVNHSGSSASTSKPPEDTLPPVYAAVDKGNKKGKPLYATLDSVALESAGSQKSKENRPPPTEYATLDSLALQSNDSTKRDEDRPKPTEYADIDFLKSKEGENTGHPV